MTVRHLLPASPSGIWGRSQIPEYLFFYLPNRPLLNADHVSCSGPSVLTLSCHLILIVVFGISEPLHRGGNQDSERINSSLGPTAGGEWGQVNPDLLGLLQRSPSSLGHYTLTTFGAFSLVLVFKLSPIGNSPRFLSLLFARSPGAFSLKSTNLNTAPHSIVWKLPETETVSLD